MIPVSDANPTRRTPIMNLLLIGLNIVVFLYEIQLSNRGLNRFVFQWGVIPSDVLAAIAHPLAPGASHAFLTLITSQFIHANFLHIIGNMLFLFIFGDNIEDVMGSFTYLVFYLLSGIAAGLTQAFVFAPFLGGGDVPSIGASGAIAGVLGAYLILYPTTRIRVIIPPLFFLPFSLPAIVMIGFWFVLQFISGVGALSPSAAASGGVAYWAHVGGFVTGMILIFPFWGKAREMRRPAVQRYYAPPPSPYDDGPRW